jgi:hypothetical protein
MEREGTGNGLGSGSAFRQLDERLRKPLFDSPEKRDRRGPRRPVARLALRAQMSAKGEELGEVGDHSHISLLGNAHETVSVEIVAEEDARVPVGRCEQASPPVVEEIALVDRLNAEREALVREGREDRKLLPFRLRPTCCTPERTLPLRLPGDRVPERGGSWG